MSHELNTTEQFEKIRSDLSMRMGATLVRKAVSTDLRTTNGMDKWSVTVHTRYGTHTLNYWQGIAHRNKEGNPIAPKLKYVVESMISDASLGTETFDDFCGYLGYDTDSPKALQIYLDCQAMVGVCQRLFRSYLPRLQELEL